MRPPRTTDLEKFAELSATPGEGAAAAPIRILEDYGHELAVSKCGLDPVSWTLSERRIACPHQSQGRRSSVSCPSRSCSHNSLGPRKQGQSRSRPVRAGLGGVRRRSNASRMVPSCAPGRDHDVPPFSRRQIERRWCGRRGSNPHEPLQALRIFMPLRLSPPPSAFVVWTIPSPSGTVPGRCCPSSLYTFPEEAFRPGLARDRHFRVPRLWAVLHRRFPRRALKFSSSPLRLPVSPRPRGRSSAAVHDRTTARNGRPQSSSASRRGFACLPDFGFLFVLGLILLPPPQNLWVNEPAAERYSSSSCLEKNNR